MRRRSGHPWPSAALCLLALGCGTRELREGVPHAEDDTAGGTPGDTSGHTGGGDTRDTWDTGATDPCGEPSAGTSVEFSVGRTLPVVGEPMVVGGGAGNLLCIRFDGGETEWEILDSDAWTPSRTGRADLWIVTSDGTPSEARAIWVTPTRLYFDFWTWREDQAWITSGLAVEPVSRTDEIRDRDLALLERGGLPLNWTWGSSYPYDVGVDGYLALMADGYPDNGYPGIVVDEVYGYTAADDQYGEAIVQLREMWPDVHVTVYTVAGVAETTPGLRAGLEASDLVIAESYASDFRSYASAFDRYESLNSEGLKDHAIGAVCLSCATTPKEIRQQLAYVRTRFPDMPGIAWFSAPASDAVAQDLDALIEEAFLGPAVTVETDGRTATVRSIGASDVGHVLVSFLDDAGATLETADIGALPSGATESVTASQAFDSVLLELPDGGVDLTWTDPRSLPPPTAAESEAAEVWRDSLATGTTITLGVAPELEATTESSDTTPAAQQLTFRRRSEHAPP